MEDQIMKNGIIIERHQDGIIVDGILHVLNHGEEKDIVSEYFFKDYWEAFTANPSEGELSPNSLFIKYGSYAPLPCASGFTLFTYCNSVKFVAGYLKFMVLCELVSSTLIDLSEFTELSNGNNISFDIDFFMEEYKTNDADQKNVCEKIKHILCLCNLVFLEQDETEIKKHLLYVVDKFSEYFSEVCGWNFELKVYDGIKNAKDEILSFIGHDEETKQLSKIISKANWSEDDKVFLSEMLESIIG